MVIAFAQLIAPNAASAASPTEPALGAAYWSPGEAGVSVSLVSGEAVLTATDFAWRGRMLTLALERVYRSGSLGYGPLGAAGWHSPLFAHLRENRVTGELQYYDGRGRVFRFLPLGKEAPPDGWEADPNSGYAVPKGLYARIVKEGGGRGWMLLGRNHDFARFDAKGRLIEISDRLRQYKEPSEQGSTIRLFYDFFDQVKHIEDDLGRKYDLAYFEDPRPESKGGDGPRYGLLKKVTDFAGRTIEYEFDDQRRLVKVKLPEVTTTAPDYAQYAFSGANRPTIEYRYDPQANVTSSNTDTTAILHGDFAKLRLEGFVDPGGTVLRARFEYDGATGRVKAVAFPDPDGNNAPGSGVAWSLSYPAEPATAAPATKVVIRSPWGQDTEYTLADGRISEVKQSNVEALAAGDATPPLGGGIPTKTIRTSYGYEDDGRLQRLTRADGSVIEVAYAGGDRLGRANVTSVTEKPGTAPAGPVSYADAVTTFTYSEDNLVARTTDPDGRGISGALARAGGGLATAGYHAEGVLSELTFDRFGRVTRSATAGEAPIVTTASYDADARSVAGGGLLKSITAGGFTETFVYDTYGDLKERATSYGSSAAFTNDEWDRVVAETTGRSGGTLAPVNAKAQRAFDAAGRLVREKRHQAGIGWVETRYEYNARGQITGLTQTGLAGPAPGGGLVEGTTRYGYDSFGRLCTATSAGGIVTTTTYDSAGRVASTQTGGSGIRRRAYDELGRLVLNTDGHDGSWRGRFDGWGRLYEEQSAASALIERQHDRAGGLVRESVFADPAKEVVLQQTTFAPTSFGGIARSEELVAGGGSPTTSIVTTNNYDGAARIVATRRSAVGAAERIDQQVTYEPGTGRQLSIITPAGATTFAYTSGAPWADGITTTETTTGEHPPVVLTTTLGRDALGRVILEQQAGTTTQRLLDESGNTLSVTSGSSGTTISRFDARGLLLSSASPAIGREVQHGFDADGRVLATAVRRESATHDLTSYSYDSAGRMSARTRPSSPTEAFGYYPDDTLATWATRLESATGEQLVLSHVYDPANRLTSRSPANPEAFGGAGRPAGLAPLDGGDVMTYDALGRLTSAGILPQPSAPGIEPTSLVTYASFDSRGLPHTERVGFWPQAADLERRYDPFGNPTATLLPQGIAGSASFAGFAAGYDALDRLQQVAQAADSGFPIAASPFAATLGWAGAARPLGVTTAGGLATSLAYTPDTGRLDRLGLAAGDAALGAAQYRWDVARDLKTGRQAESGMLDATGWDAGYDTAGRMTFAEAPLGTWHYTHGAADELLSVIDSNEGAFSYTSGPEGRIEARTGPGGEAVFRYDGEGRRIDDDLFAYTWDWRGRLVATDLKTGEHAGERISYAYDATGRLLSRTHLAAIPAGGTDTDRPFIAKRAFTWDGQRLVAEAGLNFHDEVIWRQQYAPGPHGLDDAPLVHVERDLLGTPSEGTFALVRDEMASVLAVLDVSQSSTPSTEPGLLVRSLYAPYGARHTEIGPEILDVRLDPAVVKAGDVDQGIAQGDSQPGALVVRTTLALNPATFDSGLRIESWDAPGGAWVAADRADYAIGAPGLTQGQIGQTSGEGSQLAVLRRAGWSNGQRYRITLTAALRDSYGRRLQLPATDQDGMAALLDVPTAAPPVFARRFELRYGAPEPDPTFGGVLPGGLTSAFQGAWSDPLTHLGYHRARWLDRANTAWLSPDQWGTPSAGNWYIPLGWQPMVSLDPQGLRPFPGYEWFTGAQAHGLFSQWMRKTAWYRAVTVAGGTVYLNKSLRRILRETTGARLGPESPLDAVDNDVVDAFADPNDLWRPDVVGVPLSRARLGELFELKPEGQRPSIGLGQLRLYATALRAGGLRVEQADFGAAVPEALSGRPLDGVVLDAKGNLFKIEILSPALGQQKGMVYYRLIETQLTFRNVNEVQKALRWVLPLVLSWDLVSRMIDAGGNFGQQLPPGALAAPLVITISPCLLDPYGPGCRELGGA